MATRKNTTAAKTTRKKTTAVPSNPILFLIAAIRSRVILNQAQGFDTAWCHQTYAPKGSAYGVRGLFLQALTQGMLTFPAAIKKVAAGMEYAENVALYVATVRAASDQGVIIERNFGGHWKVAVREDLPERGSKDAKQAAPKDIAAELAM